MAKLDSRFEWIEDHQEDSLEDDQLTDYAQITEGVAQELNREGAYTAEGVSLTATGKSTELRAEDAVAHDVLGWILIVSARVLKKPTESNCVRASIGIGARVQTLEKRSMLEINDEGTCADVISAMLKTAESFRTELGSRHAASARVLAWEGNRLVG